jgi:UDP-glucose 4-epimerase
MRVVVTGGLGFIGSHIVEKLVMGDNDVVVLDDKSNGDVANIGSRPDSPNLNLVVGDVRSRNKLRRALVDADVVIHLAAVVSVLRSLEDPALTTEVNVGGTLNVLSACIESGVRRMVFASSAAVYGGMEPPLEEDRAPIALSPYAASKIAGEAYCRAFSESQGLETVILRFFNVYGPRSTGPYAGVMVKFAQAIIQGRPLVIFGDGEQTRDFVHVNDVADAAILAMNKNGARGEVFNIGTGISTSVNGLAKIFLSASDSEEIDISHVEPRQSEVRHSRADIRKAVEQLGYKPGVKLESGVEEYLSWFNGKER